ncbi:hypothetical protein HY450_01390, partial [Candidatus Pacearchaeota archaeon]|nr:hypothetical protein [Candidatus Pacearchaeota archaeon]
SLGKEKAKQVSDLIARSMARETKTRPQSVDEFVSEMNEITGYREENLLGEMQTHLTEKDKQIAQLEEQLRKSQHSERKTELEEAVETNGLVFETTKGIGNDLARATRWIYGVLRGTLGNLLFIPTSVMSQSDAEGNYNTLVTRNNENRDWSFLSASIGIVVGAFYTLPTAISIPDDLDPKYLYVPWGIFAATNAISGAVELVRHNYRKARSKRQAVLEETLKETGMTLLEYEERKARHKKVLKMIKKSDLSFLVDDNKFRNYEETKQEGIRVFEQRFGSGIRTEQETYKFFIENGMAYDKNSAEKTIDYLNRKRGILYLEECICSGNTGKDVYLRLEELKNGKDRGFKLIRITNFWCDDI